MLSKLNSLKGVRLNTFTYIVIWVIMIYLARNLIFNVIVLVIQYILQGMWALAGVIDKIIWGTK